jgi:MSHA biogenesis protein MshP
MKNVRGFALVSAIFILVVLAALGAFILNISTNQQIGSALDVQGVRAYQAARAGIEWGLYQQLPLQRVNLPTYATCAPGFGTFPDLVFGFTVTVSCTPYADPTHGGPTVYEIVSTACSQAPCPNTSPGNLYIERRLTVTF